MNRLSMAFLGPPLVKKGDERLSFRTRRALALLAYLTVEGGHHSRESLATLLWPDQDSATGRARLRTCLYYLRQSLGGSGAAGGERDGGYLISSRSDLGFNFNADYELDVELLREVRSDSDLERLRSSTELYRRHFLEGFAPDAGPLFENWMAGRRQEYQIKMNSVLDSLAAQLAKRGESEQALQVAQRWSDLDPLSEGAYQRRIELNFEMGNRSAALQAYEACRRILEEELGVEPVPKTVALAEWVKSRRLAPAAEAPRRTRPPTERLPFVGRAKEHEILVEEFERVRRGRARLILLEGEAGIGKSRLAREWQRWAQARGATVLSGRAFDAGGRVPYQPLLDAFRELISEQEVLAQLDPAWRSELARLFPEIGDRASDEAADRTDETASIRMFEAFVQLAIVMSQQTPIVLSLDDLQWTDVGTRDLLAYAASRWHEERARVMLLLAQRPPLVSSTSGEATMREQLERLIPVSRIELVSLIEEETEQWVRRLAGAEAIAAAVKSRDVSERIQAAADPGANNWPWAELARRLHAETGGHPFYLTETLKGLLDRKVLCWEGSQESSWRIAPGSEAPDSNNWAALGDLIAPNVSQAVLDRLNAATEDMFELLVAAAVLGQSATFEHVCAVAGVSQGEALLPIDQLVEARLLEEASAAGEVPYQFSHDQIRQVTYEQAGGARRRLFHRRAFELLAARQGSPAELAHHACAAGQRDAALRYGLQAGQRALEVFAVRDAIRHFERAREALDGDEGGRDPLEPVEVRSLYELLGRAYEVVNEWGHAQSVYRELLAGADRRGDQHGQVSARLRLAALAMQRDFDVDRAAEILEGARRVADRYGDTLGLAEAEWRLSTTNYFRFQRQAALAHAERAVELARSSGDKDLIAGSLNALGYARQGVGRWSGVEPPLVEAIELYQDQANPAMEVDCRLMLAVGHLHLGELQQAFDEMKVVDSQLQDVDNPWGKANHSWVMAQALIEAGRYQVALDQASAGFRVAMENNLLPLAASALTARGVARRSLADFEGAVADHQQAAAMLRELPNPHVPPVLSPHLGIDLGLSGDWAGAAEQATEAVTDDGEAWLHAATWLGTGFHHWTLTEALLRGDKIGLAERLLERFDDLAGDNPRYLIAASRSRAVWAHVHDDLEDAIVRVERAQKLSRRLDLPGQDARHAAKLAQLYQEAGRSEDAEKVRDQARDTIKKVAARISHSDLRAGYLGWFQERGISNLV